MPPIHEPSPSQARRLSAGTVRLLAIGVLAVLCALAATLAGAQPRAAIPVAQAGPGWSSLNPAERRALAPLAGDWPAIDAARKQKWLEIASRFDRMSGDERNRVQQRMADWVRLSPKQRNEARQNYQGAQDLSRSERQERWEAYQSLPEAQRRSLAERADAHGAAPAATRAERERAAGSVKINTVPNTLLETSPPRRVAPTVVQARPGATTRPLAQRPNPPLHQQTGLPKVAATPEFVDAATLLPQRGPQGAATAPRRKPGK